jgi:hypothetical protein
MRKTKALTQAYAMQDLVFDWAMAFKRPEAPTNGGTVLPEPDPKAAAVVSQLAKAWDILEERKRILRGRPLPGSLRPKEPKTKKTLHFHDLSSCVPKRIVRPDLDQTNETTGPETPVQ